MSMFDFIDANEEKLMEYWDRYKYDHLYEYFDPNNVDFYDEDMFYEMVEMIMDGKIHLV